MPLATSTRHLVSAWKPAYANAIDEVPRSLSHRMTLAMARRFLRCVPLAVLAACGSRYTGTPAPSAQLAAVEAPVGPHYRLALVGISRPEGPSLELVRGTTACCSEVRAGWLVERGGYWVAVDTVAKRIQGPDHAISFHAAGPFFIRVDSGPVARTTRGDSLFFTSSVTPGVIPAAATVGVRRGDTLTVTPDNRRLGYPVDFVRVYVRAR